MSEQWDKMKPFLARANLAFYANEFLTGPPEAPFNGRFMTVDHHVQWADLVNEHKLLCINAARGHGKSACAGTLVLRADGARIPVEHWNGGDVLSFDVAAGKFEPAFSPRPVESVPVPCVRVRTRTGREIDVTREHPFLTFDGWVEAAKLPLRERIALPRSIEVGEGEVEDAWLLGTLVGNGSMTSTYVEVATVDPAVREGVLEVIKRRNWCVREVGCVLFLHANWAKTNGPIHFTRAHGLQGTNSYTKRVPAAVNSSAHGSVCEFLAGLVDTDCHVDLRRRGTVEFFSVSKDLMKDVQHLLQRIGVVSVLSKKRGTYKGEPYLSWRLMVRGRSVEVLASKVHPKGKRAAEFRELLARRRGERGSESVDVLPRRSYSLLTRDRNWFRRKGEVYRPGNCPTRAKMRRLAALEPDEGARARVLALCDAPLLWDEVVEIEDLGLQVVYPLHVPGNENYIANDIVNHNSHFFTLAYPIWMADKHPGSKGFIFSGSQPQADMILQKIIHEMETNPKLAHLCPPEKSRKMWSTKQIRLLNGSEIYARGYGTKVRGVHPAWIVLDDILNDNDAHSESVRAKNIDYFFNAVRPTLVPSGQLIVIGTPFHKRDLYGELSGKVEYHFARFPAVLNSGKPDERPLWPEYFSAVTLRAMRSEMGNIRFAREMMCSPVTDDSSLFPMSMFLADGVMQFGARLGAPRQFWTQFGVKNVFMGVDFGLSATVGSDYTVVWTMGVDETGTRWILDIQRETGLTFGAQKALINDVARKYRPGLIFLEANQAQRIFGETLIQETDLPIKLFHTGDAKHSLEEGVPGLAVLLENRKVRIPRGDEASIELTDLWIEEMRSMSFNGRVMSTGEHDDLVMAFWICNNAILKGNFTFAFGEQEGDKETFEQDMKEMMGEEDDDMDDFVIGMKPLARGRPRRVNAQLVQDLVEDGAFEADLRQDKSSELKPYSDVAPKLGAPKFWGQ
jgi:intein/homing endonuclease